MPVRSTRNPSTPPPNRVPHASPLRHGSAQPQFPPDPPHPSGPHLVAQRPPRPSPLALWHLLSLDAPTVAALWTLFIARCSGLTLPWTAPAAMFLAIWMIYAADRLLDARLLDARTLDAHPHHPDLEARHRFHHHHRTRFLAAIVLTALALAALLHRIDPRALHLYVLLATLLAAWMLLIHARPLPIVDSTISPETHPRTAFPSSPLKPGCPMSRFWDMGIHTPQPPATPHRLPKELAVGLFFPAAIFIPTLSRTTPSPAALHLLGWTSTWLRPTLLPAAALFACVCTLNCLYLYAWEHPTSRLHPPHDTAHGTTRWATAHLTHLALAALTLSTAAATLCLPSHHLTTGLPALACALSTAALLLLHILRHRISTLHLRAAADLVLLTPLLLLPFAR